MAMKALCLCFNTSITDNNNKLIIKIKYSLTINKKDYVRIPYRKLKLCLKTYYSIGGIIILLVQDNAKR